MDLTPSKSSFAPHERVTGDAPGPGHVTVSRLGRTLRSVSCDHQFDLGLLPEGGYSIAWTGAHGERRTTAVDVLSDPWSRLRYGFVADFGATVDVEAHVAWARRLHLTAVQFYDWAWRHEFLVSDKPEYGDPLGRMVRVDVIDALRAGYAELGATSCAYAAVYAVDREGWQRWQEAGLFSIDGKPYQLGEDFLWIVDPSNPQWQAHFIEQMRQAIAFGFDGFHLDQYGWPKSALRQDGTPVDVSAAFPDLLRRIGREISGVRWMFNNVNDFPTETTAIAPQHATYIEVWDPHSTYESLANLVSKARSANPSRPVVLSAYLKAFAEYAAQPERAEAALSLAQAAIASGGGNHLIAGGEGRMLFDPYYVNNRLVGEGTRELLVRISDFVVCVGDLLHAADRIDITETWAFGINGELTFEGAVPIGPHADAGSVWVRAFRSREGITLHFINLLDQHDATWDAAKEPVRSATEVRVRLQAIAAEHVVIIGHDDDGAWLGQSAHEVVDGMVTFDVPVRGAWTVAHVSPL